MKIVVTSGGTDLEAPAHPLFGRCPTYIFADTETMQFEAVDNPALSAPGGAGVQAAQFVIGRGVQVVVTGNVGPNAYQAFQAASIPIYLFEGGSVRQAVEAYKAGKLSAAGAATAPEHAGMGSGRIGRGRRTSRRRGQGSDQETLPGASCQEEISRLKQTVVELRKQLAEVMEELDRLEGEK